MTLREDVRLVTEQVENVRQWLQRPVRSETSRMEAVHILGGCVGKLRVVVDQLAVDPDEVVCSYCQDVGDV